MITVNNLGLQFGGSKLFERVDLQFTAGNCYGIIGANGAGKSTFVKILSGDVESTSGTVDIKPRVRMSVLKQDQFMFDTYSVMNTVIMGNARLYEIMQQKDALYAKEDFSDEDGLLVSDLETEFAEMNGWEAESDASRILQGLGIDVDLHYNMMSELGGRQKVKVLLAQALFGEPDIIILDEPTNNLDLSSIEWLEDFLLDFAGTVIVVSHDRHFLNTVCTHIVDIDFGKMNLYVGNYDFWYESSNLVQQLMRDKNRKNADKVKELENFIARFSANKSKSRQATSRKKMLDKLTIEELPASSRRYPFVGWKPDREAGKDILFVENISKTVDGVLALNNVSFTADKGDKIAFVGDSELAQTTMFKLLAEEIEPDEGKFRWGVSTSQAYFPKDNSEFFEGCTLSLLDWIRQYSEDQSEIYLRGFLGRMLFSGDDVFKPVNVLSGGERVRCMLSRMMLSGANVLMLDQPTNHLDLESITAVNNGLIDFKGNIIIASHDHQMISTVANRIIEFTKDGIIDKRMTYDEYLESKKV